MEHPAGQELVLYPVDKDGYSGARRVELPLEDHILPGVVIGKLGIAHQIVAAQHHKEHRAQTQDDPPQGGQRPADVAADAQADILGDEHVVDLCRILAGVEQVEGGDTGEGEQHIAGVALENWHGGGMVLLEKQQTRRRQIKDDPGQRNVNGQRQEPEAPTHHRAKHGRIIINEGQCRYHTCRKAQAFILRRRAGIIVASSAACRANRGNRERPTATT